MDKPNKTSKSHNDRFIVYYREMKKCRNARHRAHISSLSRFSMQKICSSDAASMNDNHTKYNNDGDQQLDYEEDENLSILAHDEFQQFDNDFDNVEDGENVDMDVIDTSDEDDNIYDPSAKQSHNEDNILSDEYSRTNTFDLNGIPTGDKNGHERNFFSQLINFIHAAQLNKTTTSSLLSLLRSTSSSATNSIPTNINALWQQLGVRFTYEKFYYCSICFKELSRYQDLCPQCNYNDKSNSELYVFSIEDELERIVQSNIDLIRWYNLPENKIMADIVNGECYKRNNKDQPRLTLMLTTDGKPVIKSKRTRTSVWPIISFLVEIPPPIREYINNILLLGLWHSPVTPPCSLLLNKVVKNIKRLMLIGINLYLQNEMVHFSVNVQLFTGDFPARAKCNQLVNHNGFYTCSMCLFPEIRCSQPCANHTLYRWSDFIRTPQQQRTQENLNLCAQQIDSVNTNIYGVIGTSPLSSILSIPNQSTFDYFHLVLEIHFRYLLSEWYKILKQNESALNFVNECLDGIAYPHTFHRRPRDFSSYAKWKASELRCFMIYTILPVFIKLSLNVPNCFPQVYISHFIFLFIYIRVLRYFTDRDEIRNMPKFIHCYLAHFSSLYDPCKELYSVHALIHLWQQVEEHGALAYNSLFASESYLQLFDKIAHGSVVLGEQICFWWSVFGQLRSKELHYSPHLFLNQKLIEDNFFDFNTLEIYRQEFDLAFNHTFGEFPSLSLKYYSRYQCGLIMYHSISYSRRKNSNSYSVCVKNESTNMELVLRYGQILFFFDVNNKPFFLLKRYLNSKNTVSSLLKPIEEINDWNLYIDRYYPIVRHSTSELVILPCSSILSKCIFFQLDNNFTICTQIELETEHD